MKRSCEFGPRCQCGVIAEVVGPGRAHCTSVGHGRGHGPIDFAFTIERRDFYVVDDDALSLVSTEPFGGNPGGRLA